MMMPKVILTAGLNQELSKGKSRASIVKENIRKWKNGDFQGLWKAAVSSLKKKKRGRKAKDVSPNTERSQEEFNADRCKRLVGEGQLSRAAQALVSSGIAPANDENLEKMKTLHPQADRPPTLVPDPSVPPLVVTGAQVLDNIKSFKKGSAPGPSGLRAEHLKVAVVAGAAPNGVDKCIEAVTKLVNVILAGKVPERAAPCFFGARLHAAKKKSGGIRPIAVGEIARRLASKCAMSAVSEKASQFLSPSQLGVGIRGGCEALAHTAKLLFQENPDLCLLQVDFQNAFNSADRELAFQEILEHFPELSSYVASCYGTVANLIFGCNIIRSIIGFHQGDPLATLLFCLLLHPLVGKIDREVPTLSCNGWLLDDGLLAGNKEDIMRSAEILLAEGPSRGLYMSTEHSQPGKSKSRVWCPEGPNGNDPLNLGILPINDDGFVYLGCPIGNERYVALKVAERVDEIKEVLEKLPSLSDSHVEFVLLRSCFSLPKVSYLLRTTSPSPSSLHYWRLFDSHIREALVRTLGSNLGDREWLQSQLPVAMAGMGLRSAEDHSSSAQISSMLETEHLTESLLKKEVHVDLGEALAHYSEKVKEENVLTREQVIGQRQKVLSLRIDLTNRETLAEKMVSSRDRARLNSLEAKHAGDWLNVFPSASLGLKLRPPEFRFASLYRLGMPLYASSGPCPVCSAPSDNMGDHSISCGMAGERIARHNLLRDALFQVASTANLAPLKEQRAILPGVDARPADVMIRNWSAGRDTGIDVTVVNGLRADLIEKSATEPGSAVQHAYQVKWTKYGEACEQEGIHFLPLPVDCLGRWHELAVANIRKLGSALGRATGQHDSEAISHTFQRLSILLVRGNCALWGPQVPDVANTFTDGVI